MILRSAIVLLSFVLVLSCGGGNSPSTNLNSDGANSVGASSDDTPANPSISTARFGYPKILEGFLLGSSTASANLAGAYNVYWYDFDQIVPSANEADYLAAKAALAPEINWFSETMHEYASFVINTLEAGNPTTDNPEIQANHQEFRRKMLQSCSPEFLGGLLIEYSCSNEKMYLFYPVPTGGVLAVRFKRRESETGALNIRIGSDVLFLWGWQNAHDYILNSDGDISVRTFVVGDGFDRRRGWQRFSTADSYNEPTAILKAATKALYGLRTGDY